MRKKNWKIPVKSIQYKISPSNYKKKRKTILARIFDGNCSYLVLNKQLDFCD